MASQVEASSLSDITQLASNPPRYPRNPTEPKRQSLTLYIARVPGSRDIILTTLKPQLKNVTAADVASSLYYFHFNTEDDARFLEEDPPDPLDETKGSVQKPLPRKPLPESARSSLELNRQMKSVSLTPGSSPKVPRRKPVTSENVVPVPQQSSGQGNQDIARRPLGPRPLLSETTLKRESLPGLENRPLTSKSESQDQASASASMDSSKDAETSPSKDMIPCILEGSHKSHDAFSITLIRRDPSSGAQWNIGNVSGHPCSENLNSRRMKINPQFKKPYFNISIQLSNPGYNAFRNPIPTGQPRNGASGVGIRPTDGVDTNQTQSPLISNSCFDRQLRMEGSSIWSLPKLQHKRALSDLSGKLSTTHDRTSSGTSDMGSAETSISTKDFGLDSNDPQSKGYAFVSPWGGRCKFSTGSGGRSLNCRHTLPAPVSTSNTTESTSSPQVSAVVTELRFNLPSSAVFSSSSKSDNASKRSIVNSGHSTKSKLSIFRNKLSPHKTPPVPARPHPTSYAAMYPSDEEEAPSLPPRLARTTESSEGEATLPSSTKSDFFSHAMNSSQEHGIDEYPRLDLSIGQEKAGGGNRGKRAKLGKLIIHDEGFKMLDLVVAANIGIWWSVWESVSH